MKTTHLKKRFYEFGKRLDPYFAQDTSTKGDPEYRYINQLCAPLVRCQTPGQWQFLVLQFNHKDDGIYLDVGLSPNEDYFGEACGTHDDP